MKPVATFTVTRGGLCLSVCVLPTVADVHRAFGAGGRRHRLQGRIVHAFFDGDQSSPVCAGRLVFPATGGDLAELVPHEVTHAVMSKLGQVAAEDDERCATLIGQLTRTIRARLKERNIEA